MIFKQSTTPIQFFRSMQHIKIVLSNNRKSLSNKFRVFYITVLIDSTVFYRNKN